jgi:Na+/H+ antiporter NhaD/arsenite permease-like protein
MMLVVLCFSSFVSDTAVTAIMIPVVIAYCQKARMPLKQFMSILGYSALTGGTNTVIGTSTNLVISSKLQWL